MGRVSVEVLEKVARTVRTALDTEERRGTFGFISHYPGGLCGYASYALGFVLHEMYPDEVFYQVGGTRREDYHSWIEYNNWIIDITTDQFRDSKRDIVINTVGQSALHNTFEETDRYIIDGTEGKVKGDVALIECAEQLLMEEGLWTRRK